MTDTGATDRVGSDSDTMTQWRELAERIVADSPRFMELAATVAYLRAMAPDERRDVREVKPEKDYTEKEVTAAERFLQELRSAA